MYRPNTTFTTPAFLLIPTKSKSGGVHKNVYPEKKDGILIFISFKSFGGTETYNNNLLVIDDTAQVEMWYRPDVKSDCRIIIDENNAEYEIISEPEDVELRHQYLIFKVRRFKGGA